MMVLRDFTQCSKVCSDVSEEPTASVFREKIWVNIHQKKIVTPKMETMRFSETSEENFYSRFINSRKYRHFNKSCESLKT